MAYAIAFIAMMQVVLLFAVAMMNSKLDSIQRERYPWQSER
jgi:hypothetical protein